MLPTSLRIGYRDYKVEPWPSKEANAAGAYGIHDPINVVIRVSVDRTGYDALDTLLHEIFHACFTVGDIRVEDGEERVVTRLASMFLGAWRDNPELRKCLNEVESGFAKSWRKVAADRLDAMIDALPEGDIHPNPDWWRNQVYAGEAKVDPNVTLVNGSRPSTARAAETPETAESEGAGQTDPWSMGWG